MKTLTLPELPYGQVQSAMFKLIQGLGEDGQRVIDQINSDPQFVDRVAKLALTGGYEPTTSHQNARKIMGKNFFGIEEARKHFGVNPSRQQLAYLAEVPFSEEVLKSSKDTHILVAVFPMSILDVRTAVAKVKMPEGQRLFYKQDWYDVEAFAKDRGEIGWALVRKSPVDGSISKTWEEQQKLLGKEEETPKAQVMVYTIIGHFLATGERLSGNIYVRCVDVDSSGIRVYVGNFDLEGLGLDSYWDNDRNGDLGVSSVRKQQ